MAPKAKGFAAENLPAVLVMGSGAPSPQARPPAAPQRGKKNLVNEVASIANVSAEDTKKCLHALRSLSVREFCERGKFKFPQWFVFSVKQLRERPAGVKRTVNGQPFVRGNQIRWENFGIRMHQ